MLPAAATGRNRECFRIRIKGLCINNTVPIYNLTNHFPYHPVTFIVPFSDDLSDKGGRLKTYFPAFSAANRSAIRLLRLKSSNSFNFANCAASVLLCTAF